MTILGGLWGWLALIGTGLAGLLGYGVLMRKSGADAAEARHDKATVETQKRMQDARARGPRTGDAAIDRMQRGNF